MKRESSPSNRSTSPPQLNPLLPSRGPGRPSGRVPPPKKAPPQKRASNPSLRAHDLPERPQPPFRGQRNGGDNPSYPSSVGGSSTLSGPVLPPRHHSRSGPPTPNKPAPGGSRPKPLSAGGLSKPPPPARPNKKPGFASPPSLVGGRGHKEEDPVVIPSGEGMSAREMADCIERDIPAVIALVLDRNSTAPQQLENLATLLENFADNARGSGVQFRIGLTSLRSQTGTLRDTAMTVLQSNSDPVVETLKTIQKQISSMSKHLID